MLLHRRQLSLPPGPIGWRPAGGWLLATWVLLAVGCKSSAVDPGLPRDHQIIQDQLIIKSDFKLSARNRMIRQLQTEGEAIRTRLALPRSLNPIEVHLFDSEQAYREFMQLEFPMFPERRALFVKQGDDLLVYAFWGKRIGEDLRHEITHGYLHALIPDMPLWLDEGLAEFFELGVERQGLHKGHLLQLAKSYREGTWRPDLQRLESLRDAAAMTQLDYAESWLWVHFLLESTPDNRALLQRQLAQLRAGIRVAPISQALSSPSTPGIDAAVVEHLLALVDPDAV